MRRNLPPPSWTDGERHTLPTGLQGQPLRSIHVTHVILTSNDGLHVPAGGPRRGAVGLQQVAAVRQHQVLQRALPHHDVRRAGDVAVIVPAAGSRHGGAGASIGARVEVDAGGHRGVMDAGRIAPGEEPGQSDDRRGPETCREPRIMIRLHCIYISMNIQQATVGIITI